MGSCAMNQTGQAKKKKGCYLVLRCFLNFPPVPFPWWRIDCAVLDNNNVDFDEPEESSKCQAGYISNVFALFAPRQGKTLFRFWKPCTFRVPCPRLWKRRDSQEARIVDERIY